MSYGLIAGLSVPDMMGMMPGAILDLFIYRRDYDDMENGIQREVQKIFD